MIAGDGRRWSVGATVVVYQYPAVRRVMFGDCAGLGCQQQDVRRRGWCVVATLAQDKHGDGDGAGAGDDDNQGDDNQAHGRFAFGGKPHERLCAVVLMVTFSSGKSGSLQWLALQEGRPRCPAF